MDRCILWVLCSLTSACLSPRILLTFVALQSSAATFSSHDPCLYDLGVALFTQLSSPDFLRRPAGPYTLPTVGEVGLALRPALIHMTKYNRQKT